MSRPVEDLCLRKQLLLARSSLCRLKIRREIVVVRENFSWRHAGAVVSQSYPVRSAVFFLAVEFVGHDRMARLLALAGKAMAIAKLAGIAIELLHRPPADPADRQQP